MTETMRYLSICGMLGYGYPLTSLEAGTSAGVDFLGADNGSTDPGPFYLGSGTGFVKPMQISRDLKPALLAARKNNIPLIIGSAGGSGAMPHVDAFLDVLFALAKENDLHFRLAVIRADIDKAVVHQALRENRIHPCGPVQDLTDAHVDSCSRLVAQMGTEPIIAAIQGRADIIVVGRCCDTAVFAAMPILRGFDPGLALHAAKIAECGAMCARPVGANDSLIVTLSPDHFTVEPANPIRRCSPASVAAHSLYEQPDPNCFYEPEGKVDMTHSTFEQISDRAVRVSGTVLVPPTTATVKLEGAALKGYRAITVGGLSDPLAIACLGDIEAAVRDAVASNMESVAGTDTYELSFYRYGLDAVTGPRAIKTNPPPREVGLVIEAVADSQNLADTVVSLARSTALHQSFTGRKATAGNLAFPFSPSDLQGGAVYEFAVYHLMRVDDPTTLFNLTFREL